MRKIIPAVVAGAAALAVAGGTFAYANLDKDVTLSVDGAASDVSTMKGTVGEVLADRGISLGQHDVVAPAPGTTVTDGTRIAVSYGRQVTVKVDGRPKTFWTTATTVGDALGALNLDAAGADLSTSRSAIIGRQGLSLDVATLKTVTIKQGRDKRTLKTTAPTVGAALDAAKITVDADDELSTSASSRLTDGASFRVTEVDVKKVTKTVDVGYDTVYKKTAKLDKGKTRVDTAGRTGERTVVYTVVRHDGKVDSRKKISSTITDRPTDKVVLVGTKEESAGSGGSNFAGGSTVWDRLAKCESGGNWAINTGNGFSGGLQFMASTWRAYGGSGAAHNASRAEQIRVAEKIRADVGYSAWPGCSAKLGLR